MTARLSLVKKVVATCDQFEQELADGANPSIEGYLAAHPDLPRDDLLRGLLAIELEYRFQGDDVPAVHDFLCRFPDSARLVRDSFAKAQRDDLWKKSSGRTEPESVTATTASTSAGTPDDGDAVAVRIGRYSIIRKIGVGSSASVYLARDEQLGRSVSIKVARPGYLQAADPREFTAEARAAAALDHANIVPVHDVGQTEDGRCYIVYKFVDGTNLEQVLQRKRPEHHDVAMLVATVAEALHHAHTHGVIHRDVKPANILIDAKGTPYIADFGLAMPRADYGKAGGFIGTPAYMSPEQARGESHRVDGRTDIFSLGVVFYESLTGMRPFPATDSAELIEQITTLDVRPPRQLDDSIPAELERICLKALSKRMTDRYNTAADVAQDLGLFLAVGQRAPDALVSANESRIEPRRSTEPPACVMPKGLRSYDENDADFYLQLLPGPYDRDGLPEIIRFWKSRIEAPDGADSFPVGIVYGPSGSGKSSMIKAGLLPRLSDRVQVVFVEATENGTEQGLLFALHGSVDGARSEMGLAGALASIRRQRGAGGQNKLLIVIDQFEQWLHGRRDLDCADLVKALRQCDGTHVQCLVLLRDDFWLAATRFMTALEFRLQAGKNAYAMDLFDPMHARSVLIKYGQAYGRLPTAQESLSDDENSFVDQVIDGLSTGGSVVCVQLSLLAEMVKGKPWTRGTLKSIGGVHGVGVHYLDETFCSRSASPGHRLHQKAAVRVLESLLPGGALTIKGQLRARAELEVVSEYAGRKDAFEELVRILDEETRLITPVEAETVAEPTSTQDGSGERYYQLTHDYLIPSLRQWIAKRRQETRAGRARLLLEERTAMWQAKPEPRMLPSTLEFLKIRSFVPKIDWTQPQRQLMKKAARRHGIFALLCVAIIVALGTAAIRRFEAQRKQHAIQLANDVLLAEITEVPQRVRVLRDHGPLADDYLREHLADEQNEPVRLRARLALLHNDPSQVEALRDELLVADHYTFSVIRDALAEYPSEVTPFLWNELKQVDRSNGGRWFRAACAAASYSPRDARWNQRTIKRLADYLIELDPQEVASWTAALGDLRDALAVPLNATFRDPSKSQAARVQAASILAHYVNDPEGLANLVMDADQDQFSISFPKLAENGESAVEQLRRFVDQEATPRWPEPAIDSSWSPVDQDTLRTIEEANGIVVAHSALCQTLPRARFDSVAESLYEAGYRPARIRPFVVGESIRVAALWNRDGLPWEYSADLSEKELTDRDAQLRQDGFVPLDVTSYLSASENDDNEREFAALWYKPNDRKREARIVVGELAFSDDWTWQSLQVFPSRGARIIGCGVAAEPADTLGASDRMAISLGAAYSGRLYPGKLQTEVRISLSSGGPSLVEYYTRRLKDAETGLSRQPNDLNFRMLRARANFYLGNNDEALADLNRLLDSGHSSHADTAIELYSLRVLVHARLGGEEAARADILECEKRKTPISQIRFLDAVVSGYTGSAHDGAASLEAALQEHPGSTPMKLDAARAYAITSQVGSVKQSEVAEGYVARAVELVESVVTSNPSLGFEVQQDVDLQLIAGHALFKKLQRRLRISEKYVAVWKDDHSFKSEEIHGLSPDEHRSRCEQQISRGYRPVSISAAEIDGHVITASLWQHPRVSDYEVERLAKRKANAAIALWKLGNPDATTVLLRHQPDPTIRSYLVDRIGPYGVSPREIVQLLPSAPSVDVRRALILALGRTRLSDLGPDQSQAVIAELVSVYRDDADAGVHGAVEWVLRRWGIEDRLSEVNTELSAKPIDDDRDWYINGEGHTMVVLRGPHEFLMGAPSREKENDDYETQHRVRIDRSFAIATKEVSLTQFLHFNPAFLNDKKRLVKRVSPAADCPVPYVTFPMAAQYCNWLSEREGISPDQWCYVLVDDTRPNAAVELAPQYLERTGYRLPTEAEWELASRAGCATARFYGETAELLDRYAVHAPHDQTLPCGQLMPNDFGLFDMLGNVFEWTQNRRRPYLSTSPFELQHTYLDEEEEQLPVRADELFVVRGRCYGGSARNVRSAERLGYYVSQPHAIIGFRVVRTHR